MIPSAFEYVRPSSIDEAVSALAEHGDDAKVLAGGHSLLPLMRLRLADPEVIVDIGRIDDLRGIREDGDHVVIGATATHREVIESDLVRRHCPVLADVTETVGDHQVRHRGTLGGAIAHGDAAGDQPSAILALEADLVAQGPNGRRTIAASQFFHGFFETALEPEELLVEIRVPKLQGSWGHDYQKFNRVAQAWAVVGVCALVRRDNGAIGEARIGLTNMGAAPLRARAVEQALSGASADGVAEAAEHAADDTQAPSDLNADASFRSHLARVLTRRAVDNALGS